MQLAYNCCSCSKVSFASCMHYLTASSTEKKRYYSTYFIAEETEHSILQADQILSHGEAHIITYSAVFFPCPELWDIGEKAR